MVKRILYVEDNEDSREIIVYLFGSLGYEVVTASTGREAVELAQKGGFDLILLDSVYPDEEGTDICSNIRDFDSITPVIFYSGAVSPQQIERGLKAGAQGYISKPEFDQLIELNQAT